MERTLTHVSASCSGLLRPTRPAQRLAAQAVRVNVPRRAARFHAAAPKAVASFTADNAATTYQEAAPITDVSLLHLFNPFHTHWWFQFSKPRLTN
jgi:hypothetical protein